MSLRQMFHLHLFQKTYRRRLFLGFALLTAFSLCGDFITNSRPLALKDPRNLEKSLRFPFLEFVPRVEVGQIGESEADFSELEKNSQFLQAGGWVVWALVPWGDSKSDPEVLHPPAAPSVGHWMGTDDRGRDVFSRILLGYRSLLWFSLLATVGIYLVGLFIGTIQGYFGGWIDLVLQRGVEGIRAFPPLYLFIFVGAVLVPTFWILLLSWVLIGWISLGQFVRGEVLRGKAQPYIVSAKRLGYGLGRILVFHLLPNIFPRLVTVVPFIAFNAVLVIASADFLGVGLPSASLGEMFHQAMLSPQCWWLWLFPGVVLSYLLLFLQSLSEVFQDGLAS